ncbi:transcription elongation factor spt4 [Didymella pomorum]|uniref:Transcription elongation factor SPT4 n=1 Tax=Didymella pomorum TaxID=749634 RepID=A0A9W8ZBF1_9PLEO|nr:transcription elongation factor spt4 [Didymella pomorum]
MPPKKGLATTKKVDKYVYVNEDTDFETSAVSDTESSKTNALLEAKRSSAKQSNKNSAFLDDSVKENIDPNDLRGIPKRSNPIEPCQDSQSFSELQQTTFTNSIFPPGHQDHTLSRIKTIDSDTATKPHRLHRTDTTLEDAPRTRSHLDQHSAPSTQKPARTSKSRGSKLRSKNLDSITSDSNEQLHLPSDPPFHQPFAKMTTMIPGGAFVPPNQQRNLRACMVCSIVRTYTQFMNGGCPNCEEILELAGNSENVNDCTSQVFEGLITVADTSKSWVARYQRLEGYVAGVYATQVEGILPEEIISAIEAAGINYVPRDGSEDQMIPKD